MINMLLYSAFSFHLLFPFFQREALTWVERGKKYKSIPRQRPIYVALRAPEMVSKCLNLTENAHSSLSTTALRTFTYKQN
jgi:hypothetical protein